ncbi:hypothetical protein [Alicyclobacillus mengziensis]|uniref:Uncharacterized protein n=1 Tax=Alicyclobacillus mengziensis TaxID=2931921 RepID=A0A9X7W391_9BACL|nr:hypothetical protein [Alicyclobacillus mengziensis]QSO48488.1 hypothetical protein JZ786_05735 [Alicyclobacillus mengziensis]
MPKPPKISISFKGEYLAVYDWLKSRDNISAYICQLVLADMTNGVHSDDFEARVETILLKLLKNRNLIEQGDGIKVERDNLESLSNDENDLINSLF